MRLREHRRILNGSVLESPRACTTTLKEKRPCTHFTNVKVGNHTRTSNNIKRRKVKSITNLNKFPSRTTKQYKRLYRFKKRFSGHEIVHCRPSFIDPIADLCWLTARTMKQCHIACEPKRMQSVSYTGWAKEWKECSHHNRPYRVYVEYS